MRQQRTRSLYSSNTVRLELNGKLIHCSARGVLEEVSNTLVAGEYARLVTVVFDVRAHSNQHDLCPSTGVQVLKLGE